MSENGGHRNERSLGDLDEKNDGSFSAKGTLSGGSAETGDGKSFKEAAAYCVLAK